MTINTNAGSTDYFYSAIYRYHPNRFPVYDNYDLHAVRSELNEYPSTPGEEICRTDFASKFSILFKFRPHDYFRFTILSISDANGDIFSVAIDMIDNSVIVSFSGCNIIQLDLPLGRDRITVGDWHRIGLSVDPGVFNLYLDCEKVFTHIHEHNCRVICDETVNVTVLQSSENVCQIILASFLYSFTLFVGYSGHFTIRLLPRYTCYISRGDRCCHALHRS